MDLLQALGIAPPAADGAVCYEIYDKTFLHGDSVEQLDALAGRCMQLVMPCMDGYIWQHEPFRLHSSIKQPPPWVLKKRGKAQQQQQQQQSELPCLWGVVRYDDNVEDEWFVVWLLLELSRQITTLCCRVWDDDGDFLLVEAAYSLPRWLKPETSTNRVWLRCGELHIIPQPSSRAPTLPQQPTIRQAVQILSSGIVDTHRPKVEAAALSRARVYPDALQQSRQRVLARLPRRVGRLLQEDPQMVAAAVAAFITRTRDEVQSAARWCMFPPSDMTTALVTMNRCQYAQLMQADFTTPKGYPPAPTAAAAGSGVTAALWLGGDEHRQQKALDMGIKIHTGMEIMCLRMGLNSSSNSSSSSSSNVTLQDAAAAEPSPLPATSVNILPANHHQQQLQQQLSSNPAWHHYLTVLRQSGYFSGEIEGSARYKQLMAAAQAAFLDSGVHLRSTEALAGHTAYMQALLLKVDQQQQGVLTPQQLEGGRSAAAAVLDADGLIEDSDSWMQDAAAAVQQQLAAAEAEAAAHEARKQQRRAGPAAAGGSQQESGSQHHQQQQGGSSNNAVMVDAEQFVAAFRGFVDHATAGPEGAEVPQIRNSSTAAAAAARSAGSNVQFDPDAFLAELMGICGTAGSSSSNSKKQQQDPDALLSQLQSLQQRLLNVIDNSKDSDAAAVAAGGGHPLAAAAAAADDDDVDSEYDTSSSEGSSFYGSNDGDDETSDEDQSEHGHASFSTAPSVGEAHQHEPVQLPVSPPVSSIHRQQQQQQQKADMQQQQQYKLPPSFRGSMLQAAEDVLTESDSDDEDNLSLGGSDDSGSQSDSKMSDSDGGSHGKNERPSAHKSEESQFYDAYDAALESELAGTSMAQSFGRCAVQEPAAAAAVAGSSAGQHLAPLDIDMNLIKSLVASYSAQGGLPGPASNLAGLLGLQLPTEVVEDK